MVIARVNFKWDTAKRKLHNAEKSSPETGMNAVSELSTRREHTISPNREASRYSKRTIGEWQRCLPTKDSPVVDVVRAQEPL